MKNQRLFILSFILLLFSMSCTYGIYTDGPKVDIVAPQLSISAPAKDGETFSSDFVVSGIVSDDLSQRVKLQLLDPGDLTNTRVIYSNGWNWDWSFIVSIPIDSQEGERVLEVRATDESGKTTIATRTVVIQIQELRGSSSNTVNLVRSHVNGQSGTVHSSINTNDYRSH